MQEIIVVGFHFMKLATMGTQVCETTKTSHIDHSFLFCLSHCFLFVN